MKQSDLYLLCGRDDSVASIVFRPHSNSEKMYGANIIALIQYTLKERNLFEKDVFCMDDKTSMVRAKLLLNTDPKLQKLMITEGFDISDVISIDIIDNLESNNMFYSPSKRHLNTININTTVEGSEQETLMWYRFLKLLKSKQIALCPDEVIQYLAYKTLFDKDKITEEEHNLIYDYNGNLNNENVCYYLLLYEKSLHPLDSTKMQLLSQIKTNRFSKRYNKLNDICKGFGGFDKFLNNYPEKAKLLFNRTMKFPETRYSNGKHLLYLDIDGFLHIYIRHLEELSTPYQYSERTKFQLREEDVLQVIRYVMTNLDDEYQKFKDENPNKEFSKYSDQAYYFKGDYYTFRVDNTGRLITFYKTQQNRVS